MKKVILFVQDNVYDLACMKNCAETIFKVKVIIKEVQESELVDAIVSSSPERIVYQVKHGIEYYLSQLKDLKASKLTTEVHIIYCQSSDCFMERRICQAVDFLADLSKEARGKMWKKRQNIQPAIIQTFVQRAA